jgi:hypothetical protein
MRPILWLDKVMDRDIDDAIMLTHSANTRKRSNVYCVERFHAEMRDGYLYGYNKAG